MREAGLRRELETQTREMTRLREQLRERQERIPGGPRRVRHRIDSAVNLFPEKLRTSLLWTHWDHRNSPE